MYLDRQNTVSQAQAITATAVSTDTIDLSVVRDIGPGEDLRFGITVDQTFNNLTSLTFQVITASTADLATGQTILVQSDAIPLAQLTAGRRPMEIVIPRTTLLAQPIGQRFLGLRYVVSGTAPTAGQVTSFVQNEAVQDIGKNYPGGFAIL